MGSVIDFGHKVKELSRLVRNLNNSNDELSRSFAITQAQSMLDEYKYDLCNMNDSYNVSQFCQALLALLYKLE